MKTNPQIKNEELLIIFSAVSRSEQMMIGVVAGYIIEVKSQE